MGICGDDSLRGNTIKHTPALTKKCSEKMASCSFIDQDIHRVITTDAPDHNVAFMASNLKYDVMQPFCIHFR